MNGRRDGAPAELSGEDRGALQSYGVDCPVCGFMRDIRAHTFKGHAEGRRTLFPDVLGKKFPAQPNVTHFCPLNSFRGTYTEKRGERAPEQVPPYGKQKSRVCRCNSLIVHFAINLL